MVQHIHLRDTEVCLMFRREELRTLVNGLGNLLNTRQIDDISEGAAYELEEIGGTLKRILNYVSEQPPVSPTPAAPRLDQARTV